MQLGGGRGVGSMPSSGSDPTRKPGDAESEEFPAGLRVLVVDDDPTCLKILERMLVSCRYEVTKCQRVEYALNELRRNRNGFDVVISDVHMPNMDGFKLLEYVGLEMDLPVIMMSVDDSKNVVMKGVKHGACDYLIKPVRMDALQNIWQHVVRRKKNEWHEFEPLNKGQKHDTNEDSLKNSKRRGDEEEADAKDDYAYFKKQRVVWSIELHQQFVAAVNQLGIDKAVPKKILELMNVPGLTRENVGSHLQKYRLCLRKLTGEPHHFGGMNDSFMGPPNSRFVPLGGFDLQTFNAYQPTLSGVHMPVHQTNPLGYDATNFSLSELQQSAYFPSFYQPVDSLGSAILPQPLWSNGARIVALPRNNSAQIDQRLAYASLPQPPLVIENHSVNHVVDQTGLIQDGVSLDKKLSRGFDPNYDAFNDFSQQMLQDWQTGNSFRDNINAQTGNNLVADNISSTVKVAETVQEASSASNHFNFEFDQDDLFGILLNQREEDIRAVEGELKFDVYDLESHL